MKLNKWTFKALARHAKELEALGAEDGVEAYNTLCRIERRAHKLAEDACNYGMEDSIIEKRKEAIKSQVKKVFGGKLPNGFFLNGDPRGYSLKISVEGNRIFANSEDGINRDGRAISYTNLGGYGILAPEFE